MIIEPINYVSGTIYVDKTTPIKDGQLGWSINDCTYTHFKHLGEHYGHAIVAQSPDLLLRNIPYLEAHYAEEEDSAAIDYVTKIMGEHNLSNSTGKMMIDCYKAASGKKWSDEDIMKAYYQGCKDAVNSVTNELDFITPESYLQSLQPKIKSIEIEMDTEYYVNNEWKSVLLPSEWDDSNPTRQVPMTYQKNGKTFLKIKQINYV